MVTKRKDGAKLNKPKPKFEPLDEIKQEDVNFSGEYAIEMCHICKNFVGIKANDDITLKVRKGEIHALLGENGAGKSTLMSILFGLYVPDSGEIYCDGKKVSIKDPNQATKLGIGMVHQHFMLIDCFTALENIYLGSEPTDKLGFIHKKKCRQLIEDLCKKYHFNINLDMKIEDMTVGMQQKVEIIKMLYRKSNILIFDEPTAVLTPQEINELINSIKSLAKEGKSIVFISHKLNEIMDVADRVTVLRKGKCVGTLNIKDTNVNELSRLMVGRDVELTVKKKQANPGKAILTVKNLVVHSHTKRKDVIENVSFEARSGEITCIAGVEGNGQSDLIYAITGLKKIKSGEILLANNRDDKIFNIAKMSIRKRNVLGVSHIPEDRHKFGLLMDFDLKTNVSLKNYFKKPFQKLGFISNKQEKLYADKLIEKFDIRSAQGSTSIVRQMSGGNQQKAIVAREINQDSDLLIAAQPTRGLDVGAIEFIHKQIILQRDKNKAVLLLSLELEEVMNLADRILVMYEGEIVGDLNPHDITFEELGLYMAGVKRNVISNKENFKKEKDKDTNNLKEGDKNNGK